MCFRSLTLRLLFTALPTPYVQSQGHWYCDMAECVYKQVAILQAAVLYTHGGEVTVLLKLSRSTETFHYELGD